MAGSGIACPRKIGLLLIWTAAALVSHLAAQKVVSARAGLISYLQGPVFVDGKRVFLKTTRFQQMENGQTLSTGRGRVELLLAPGVPLRLAENSQLRIEDTKLADTRITLQRGDALIEIVQLPEGARIQVSVAETVTELTRPGLYRFGTIQNTLKVYGGEALVRSETKTTPAKRGMSVALDPALTVQKFDRKLTDSLHAWAARRSFELFIGDPDARERQTHWQASGNGYVENKNFGVVFRALIRRGPPLPGRPAVPPAEVGSRATPAP
jgi:hypothetical protein